MFHLRKKICAIDFKVLGKLDQGPFDITDLYHYITLHVDYSMGYITLFEIKILKLKDFTKPLFLLMNEIFYVVETILIKFYFCFFLRKRMYLFIFRERGRERERERNINVWLPLTCPLLGTWPATEARALTGNRTSASLVCRAMLNPLSHTSQGQILNYEPVINRESKFLFSENFIFNAYGEY